MKLFSPLLGVVDKELQIILNSVNPKVNEFELAYYDVENQHVSHNTMGIPLSSYNCANK